jgi:CheY-like chemotaxis protein/two-component sensor histidine kinase
MTASQARNDGCDRNELPPGCSFDGERSVGAIKHSVQFPPANPFNTSFNPIRPYAKGRPLQMHGVNLDITKRKRVEESLRQSESLFRALAESIPQLAWMADPDGHIFWFASPDDPTIFDARDMIDRQVTHLVRLVDDLLDVSRITRGKIDLRQELVDVAAVVESAIESALPLIDARRHHLDVSLPAKAVLVVADPTRLSQVILNLLNNIAKYTEEGGEISLLIERQNEQAVIRLRDNGMGIAPELLPRVVELFTQAEHTIDWSQGGLGIGLAIVRRLVELQGGSVEAQSEGPGRGSEFVVKIPVAPAPQDEPPFPAHAEPPREKLQSSRVLVVDDHADSADSLSLNLKNLGHEVETAYDSKMALTVARNFRPSIVFCDLGLPVIAGYEVARQLRGFPETRDIILVALTGYGQHKDKKRSLTAGFHSHLVKPVSPESLKELLRQTSANGDLSHSLME